MTLFDNIQGEAVQDMGSCLQNFFRNREVTPNQESLLLSNNPKQFSLLLQQSTKKDSFFYMAPELCSMQSLIDEFEARRAVTDASTIQKCIDNLTAFTKGMQNQNSATNIEFRKDIKRIKQFVENYNAKGISHIITNQEVVLLRLEIQNLATCIDVCAQESLARKGLIYTLNVYYQQAKSNEKILLYRKALQKNKNRQKPATNQSGARQSKQTSTNATSLTPSYVPQSYSPKKLKSSVTSSFYDTQQSFVIDNCLVEALKADGQIVFEITMAKEENSRNAFKKNEKRVNYEVSQHKQQNGQVLMGSSTLELSTIIFKDSVITSDVLPINAPNIPIYEGLGQKAGYLSLRAQVFLGSNFQDNYLQIVKHHQAITKQLTFLMDGKNGWEKLSEFKNSNESAGTIKRSQSVYSEYQMNEGQHYEI